MHFSGFLKPQKTDGPRVSSIPPALSKLSNSFDDQPRSFTLRATQVYRREGGEMQGSASEWRHLDRVTVPDHTL
jgi:hypothetical protein